MPSTDQRAIRSRAGAALVVERALTKAGFEKVIRSDPGEPVVSVQIGEDRWVDVFVMESRSDA